MTPDPRIETIRQSLDGLYSGEGAGAYAPAIQALDSLAADLAATREALATLKAQFEQHLAASKGVGVLDASSGRETAKEQTQ